MANPRLRHWYVVGPEGGTEPSRQPARIVTTVGGFVVTHHEVCFFVRRLHSPRALVALSSVCHLVTSIKAPLSRRGGHRTDRERGWTTGGWPAASDVPDSAPVNLGRGDSALPGCEAGASVGAAPETAGTRAQQSVVGPVVKGAATNTVMSLVVLVMIVGVLIVALLCSGLVRSGPRSSGGRSRGPLGGARRRLS